MNIFYLDKDPIVAAQMSCDKHVCKMIIESAQMLSTAHRMIDGVQYTGKTKKGRNIKRWKHPNPTLENTLSDIIFFDGVDLIFKKRSIFFISLSKFIMNSSYFINRIFFLSFSKYIFDNVAIFLH